MEYHHLDWLPVSGAEEEPTYIEFLRRSSMSAGLYILPAGSQDTQEPHEEDELYYVVEGSGAIEVGGEKQLVSAGSSIFVAAQEPHRFLEVTEEIRVLVVFSPPEGSSR